jgi:hypothetical protein
MIPAPNFPRQLVYVIAPYGADSDAERELNTQRAEAICRLAQRRGFAPICVHSAIHRGAYGDDSDEADRAAGLATDCAILRAVWAVGGHCWVLALDDRTLSAGSAVEARLWRGLRNAAGPLVRTWAEWRSDGAKIRGPTS